MGEALRIAGYAGTVLLLFGLLSFAFSGNFDLWTAVHVAGGGILVVVSLAANLGGVLRAVAARGTRQRAAAVTGTLVFTALLITVNVLAARFPKTWDATESKVHTLSDKTVSVLTSLDQPVEIAVFAPSGDRDQEGLEELLTRYAAHTRQLSYRFIDPEKYPAEADRFGVTRPGVVAARTEGERAQAEPGASGMVGEGELTTLLLRVTRPSGKRIYALSGHGEPEVTDLTTASGFGGVASILKDDNVEIRPLFLAAAEAVPGDAAAVIVAGPVKPLIPHELDALRTYLARGGRLLVMINPGDDAGLAPLLADFKLALDDDMIVDQEEIAFLGARLGVDPIIQDFPPHPITKGFRQRVRLAQARSVSIKPEGGLPGVVTQPMASTRESAWGETQWRPMMSTGQVAREETDLTGPLLVAATARHPIVKDEAPAEDAPAPEARVVLFGDSDWAVNGNLGAFFNRELLVNALHWLVGAEDLIVGPPKGLRASRLDMTQADQRNLFRFGVLLLPEVLLIGGIVAWLRRRSL